MTVLELLAPARDISVGIAAIDCGADAVYIGGPAFGARKAAGNSVEDIRELCAYAHRFGARVFVTENISVLDGEWEDLHAQMLSLQDAGVDAFIIREPRIALWDDIRVPLHASTQCAIRTVERAQEFEALGCARIILERELSLEKVREICAAVSCEVEFFVHGALCVCYSGECRLSEYLNGRSGDRGDCIQACRSLYNLVDSNGRTLVRDKALLSLKDFNLFDKLGNLAMSGITSFKIEGRLKSASYVRNVVRSYSRALDEFIAGRPGEFGRASFGKVVSGFEPDLEKSFNRGYTSLWLDGKRGKWSSMDAPRHIGEKVGRVVSCVKRGGSMEIVLDSCRVTLHNGDGFAFVGTDSEVHGLRGDVCSGNRILASSDCIVPKGTELHRNIDVAFEKAMDSQPCRREIGVKLNVRANKDLSLSITAESEDGRRITRSFECGSEVAGNVERARALIIGQLGKRSMHYGFTVSSLDSEGPLPLVSAAALNAMRRSLSEDLEKMDCGRVALSTLVRKGGINVADEAKEGPLMRTKYCIRYELGMCPVHQGARPTGPLFLENNGRRLALHFDCKVCEMTVEAQ